MRTAILLAASLLCACGEPVDSEGIWRGTFDSQMPSGRESGTLRLSVQDGNISGTGENAQTRQSFKVTGEISSRGNVSLVYTFPGLARIRHRGGDSAPLSSHRAA